MWRWGPRDITPTYLGCIIWGEPSTGYLCFSGLDQRPSLSDCRCFSGWHVWVGRNAGDGLGCIKLLILPIMIKGGEGDSKSRVLASI